MAIGEAVGIFCAIFGFSLMVFFVRGIAISREFERMPTLKEVFLRAALSEKTAKSLRRGCSLLWGLALFLLLVFLNTAATHGVVTDNVHDDEKRSAASAFFGMNSFFLLLFSFYLRQIFFNALCRPNYLRELQEKGKQLNNIEENSLFFKEYGFFLSFKGRKKKTVSYLTIAGTLFAVLSVFT